MLGYNEMANQELNLGDPFKGGRNRFRPLVPRPYLSPPSPTNHRLSLNTANTRHHHHHFGEMGPEGGKPEVVGTHQVLVSSRWNPTPEQLRALEELYRRGTRTPSAEQIQHITTQLKRYGKIEGKNVFYWFQNHKARERQKRRRQVQPNDKGSNIGGKKDNVIETELKSCKWAPSSLSKESDLTPETGVTKVAQTTTTTTTTSSILPQFQHNHTPNNHIHNNINNIKNLLLFSGERNATWHTHNDSTMVQTPFCSCCYPSFFPLTLSSPKLINSPQFNIVPKTLDELGVQPLINDGNENDNELPELQESPTLQLFPIVHGKQDDHDHKSSHDNDDDSNEKANINNPFPYYHFL